ncbi:hypothetical protein QN277_009232 [Acacia crassicarpa]|uniref:Uncharacterized protein n=2 Tax=Acacia crassicarpa TaxID=499986 RepID=A0AAE1JNH3_9FABA|nr:hypothetical protein QN277_009232 [Acacia crassicarpa]
MKHEIHCLLNPLQQTQTQSSSPGNQAKIQKVPPYLRERSEFKKHYFPKVVSIGPIHHPKGEEFKKMWTSNYLKDKVGQKQEDAEQLFGKIRSQIKELKSLYAEDVIQCLHGDDDKLAWILFVDGCASLHVMHKVGETEPSKFQALDTIVQQDLLLLENQLPYKVLKILSKNDDDADSALRSFIHHIKNRLIETRGSEGESQVVQINQPAHLLDALITVIVTKEHIEEHTEEHTKEHTKEHIHTITIDIKQSHDDKSPCKKRKDTKFPTHRNIQELQTSGIKIKDNAGQSLTSICFRHDTLFIPPLMVDDFTVQTFMNMMAYEMCPDFKSNYEISNYVSFLDSLIDHADDVKVLRKAGVINNYLGSDEEVAHIFNTASTDFVIDTGIYEPVRQQIEGVYTHKAMTWFTELRRKHFNTPWSIIGLISAILEFILTTVNLMEKLGPKKH